MPLPILVAVVAGGIALVVLAVHLTGGSRIARIDDETVAFERFGVDYPETSPSRCILSEDGSDAVLELADGSVGLVHVVGSHYLTRLVGQGEIAAIACGDGSVELRTGDVTWPTAKLRFADEETALTVARLFGSTRAETANRRAA